MKTEITGIGWIEVTTKIITVISLASRPVIAVHKWVDHNNLYPEILENRKNCQCCGKEWAGMFGQVNMVFTNYGHKVVCDDCFQNLKKRFDAKTNPLGD